MWAHYNNKALTVLSNMSVKICLLKTSKSLQTKTKIAPAVAHLTVAGQFLNNNNNNNNNNRRKKKKKKKEKATKWNSLPLSVFESNNISLSFHSNPLFKYFGIFLRRNVIILSPYFAYDVPSNHIFLLLLNFQLFSYL